MKVIKCNNYDELSAIAADMFKEQLATKPSSVFGLATGSTPLGLYSNLRAMFKKGEIDFSKSVSFNLDEYIAIDYNNPQSYHYFMKHNLFDHVNFKESFLPESDKPKEYDQLIAQYGGIDLQILGIGENGHIGFNEPSEKLFASTHITGLTESTISANSRFFDSEDDVPKSAVTMGMGTIMKSRKIILLASGEKKCEAVMSMLNDEIYTDLPATLLKAHPDTVLICDSCVLD